MLENPDYQRRLNEVYSVMNRKNIKCLLLNRSQSIQYLTGAKNVCSWVFLSPTRRPIALVLESDYNDYAAQSIVDDIRVFTPHDPLSHFKKIRQELELGEQDLVIEKDHLRYAQFEMIEKFFGTSINLNWNADFIVEEARIIKTPEEIEAINQAARLARLGIEYAASHIEAGMSEITLAQMISAKLVEEGASHGSLIYLATDSRSSLAHTPPSQNKIQSGPVVIDIHCCYRGYHADVARTLFLDGQQGEAYSAYEYFKDTLLQAIGEFRAGMTLVEAKRCFYRIFNNKNDWIQLTGPFLHGVGIMNYELPKLDHPFEGKGYPERMEENMVLACTNLGLYSKKGWGIRYEDTLVVGKDHCQILPVTPI